MAGIALLIFCTLIGSSISYNGNIECISGRSGVVNLFMWKWSDIARECVEFLGPNNYCAVQLSPTNENQLMLVSLQQPWYQRWRPVSYKLDNRGGDANSLRDMLDTCNEDGVRVYIDVVMNHMTDAVTSGYGSSGSYYQGPTQDYSMVPYSNTDFHKARTENYPIGECPNTDSEIHDTSNKEEVRYCRKEGLNDLATGSEKVRQKLVTYMNNLIDFGVAGFKIDSAKYMQPGDIQYVVENLKTLNPGWFPPNTQPFVYTDVSDLSAEQTWTQEYTAIGKITEYRYGVQLGDYIRKNDGKSLSGLKNLTNNLMMENQTMVFVDNQMTQRGLEVNGFTSVLSHHESREYQIANSFMLTWPFGIPTIMSSFDWPRDIVNDQDRNSYYGPPSNSSGDILDVIVNPDERSCGNGWTCEHRWLSTSRMVQFRNRVEGTTVVNWWDNNKDQVAFGRGNKGFIAFNNEHNVTLQQRLQTGLPAGVYCDLVSSNTIGTGCDGKTITVDAAGFADFQIFTNETLPIIAITV